MQKKNFTVSYGNGVTVFPQKAAKKIAKGEASLVEIRVLTALLMSGTTSISVTKLCTQTSLEETDVVRALDFWRGVGVLSFAGNDDAANVTDDVSIAPVTDETPSEESAPAPQKKVLISSETPKYTGLQISAMLERDGGRLREMIDECQQIMGRMFTPNETNTFLYLNEELGLEADYVITLVAYQTEKKPKCNVNFIKTVAVSLVNDGITSLEDLDRYIRDMEIYDGVSGKLRSLMGIGGRAFTKKENNTINRWTKDFGYGIELITVAYECCCDSKGSFSFDYANAILENWYKAGVHTVDEAKAEMEKFKNDKNGKNGSSDLAKSFDTGEFFATALNRSYKNMAKK